MSSTFASGWTRKPALERLEQVASHSYSKPIKKIHDGPDVSFFLSSFAYRDIMTFVLQLNHAMIPRKTQIGGQNTTQAWPLGSKHVQFSESVLKIRSLLGELESLVLEAPPDTGPRRFGNVSFRKWYSLVEERATQLMGQYLSCERLPALEELESYLLGSFGSPQRLDYGTGHELSFLAFLGCLWKLGFFDTSEAGAEERSIVLGIFEDYLNLIRKLIKTYTLEPAGSHGVWGLDDNSFLPYVFGSAQLCPPIADADETPVEGSLPRSPEPSSVIRQDVVSRQRKENMYFSAIGFISDVKSGPFWEHSPMLFDISGIRDGWGKVNKGMIKMYSAEVLGKFPVVQHFPFGSLFRWEKDPEAKLPPPTSHDVSQPLRAPLDSHAPSAARAGPAPAMGGGTAAPWARLPAQPVGIVGGVTKTPWASRTPPPPPPPNGVSMQNRPVPRGPGSGAVSDRFQSSKSATVRTDAGTQEEGEHK